MVFLWFSYGFPIFPMVLSLFCPHDISIQSWLGPAHRSRPAAQDPAAPRWPSPIEAGPILPARSTELIPCIAYVQLMYSLCIVYVQFMYNLYLYSWNVQQFMHNPMCFPFSSGPLPVTRCCKCLCLTFWIYVESHRNHHLQALIIINHMLSQYQEHLTVFVECHCLVITVY